MKFAKLLASDIDTGISSSTNSSFEQETSMQGKDTSSDDFQLEVNRIRSSINALAMKNWMFDSNEENIISILPNKNVEVTPKSPTKRSISKHRQDSNRTYSGIINQDDILKALTESQEKLNKSELSFAEKSRGRVHFAETEVTKTNASRESDEVAAITELPWNKKMEYRNVTPYAKSLKIEPLNVVEKKSTDIVFRPIERNNNNNDVTINKQIVKPVPLFASKSYQELPSYENDDPYEIIDNFQTKSYDDLLLNNIDGIRKPESRTHKLLRYRSTSNNSLNRTSDQIVYENFKYEAPLFADAVIRKKKPMPQPRTSFEEKKQSKTIVYVLDKQLDEFILQNSADKVEEAYESVLMENNVDKDRDSNLFQYLLNSREDCKCFIHCAHTSSQNRCLSYYTLINNKFVFSVCSEYSEKNAAKCLRSCCLMSCP
jgi:hypothetical protein